MVTEKSFDELGVAPDIVRALREEDIVTPTNIQEEAIPPILAGKCIVGVSKTGSGKTAAFAVPVLQRIEPGAGLQAIVVAPTRELAVQIDGEFMKFGRHTKIRTACIYGGVGLEPQITKLTRADIVVGTPGRILDHMERGTLVLENVRVVVLDEADRMVDMGFIEDVSRILSGTPEGRQVLLFGATVSDEVEGLKQRFMHDVVHVKSEQVVHESFLEQYYYNVESREKYSLLVHLLKREQTKRVMIFCSTRRMVDILARNLKRDGIHCEAIHGKMTQPRRLSVMEQFNKGNPDVLIASTVAARGLHIDEVTHVFNWDLSQDPEEYVHRVGRTARAGEAGKAITLLSERDYDVFNDVLHKYGMKVHQLEKPDFKRLRFESGKGDRPMMGDGHRGQMHSRPQGPRNGGYERRPARYGERSPHADPVSEPERQRPIRWGGR